MKIINGLGIYALVISLIPVFGLSQILPFQKSAGIQIFPILDITETGLHFLAITSNEAIFQSENLQRRIEIYRADRICKKYGYDGVNKGGTSFRTEAGPHDLAKLLIISKHNGVEKASAFEDDAENLDYNSSEAMGKMGHFFTEYVKGVLTSGYTASNRDLQFSYLECVKVSTKL